MAGQTTMELYTNILNGFANIVWPSTANITYEAYDLIRLLLERDASTRLGSQYLGAQDILAHAWFASVNWRAVEQKQALPPFVPQLNGAGDDSWFAPHLESSEGGQEGDGTDHWGDMFPDFEYVSPDWV